MPIRTDLREAGLLIAEFLDQNGCEKAEGLVPGYRLAPAPLSPKERAAKSVPLAIAARQAKNGERVAKIAECIRSILSDEPSIMAEEIAKRLNEQGLATYKGRSWTARSVATFMRNEKIEPSAP